MLIDGLQCGNFNRTVFETLHDGGFTCVTASLGFWEGSQASLDAIGRWRHMARVNSDLMAIAFTAADIELADRDGKVAVLLGFQNSSLFDGRVAFVEFFA
jgi:membrane dipeptidase